MKFYLLDLTYLEENDQTKAKLFGITEDGTRKSFLVNFDPYFYVLVPEGKENIAKAEIEKLLEKNKVKIKKIELTRKKLKGEERSFLKIICYFPPDTQKVRDIIKKIEKERGGSGNVVDEYEYSLSFAEMFFLENKIWEPGWLSIENERIKKLDIEEVPEFKILAFDLEEVEEKGEKKIIMASFWSKNFKQVITYQKANYENWVKVVKDEKELLEEFLNVFNAQNPDIVLTYNGDAFDFPILRERSEKFKLKMQLGREGESFKFLKRGRKSAAYIPGRVHVDLFPLIENILAPTLQTEVLTLNAVSAELLGDKKIEMDFQELLEAWRKRKDLVKLARYCLKDSELTFKLFDLLKTQIFEIAKISGQLLFNSTRMSYSQLVESYLMKMASLENEIIPNQPKYEEISKRKQFTYAGGYVKEPIPGLHENIAVVDFRSLYPSIIATFNISPETLNCVCCPGNKIAETEHWICKNKKGFVATIIQLLLEKRWEIKKMLKEKPPGSIEYEILDNRQHVMKLIANATYGYFGFAGSRWYCKECAEVTAAIGRKLIKESIEEASKYFTVIYADTDSKFLKPLEGKEKDFKKDVEKFLEEKNKKLPGILKLELQGFYQRGLFIPRETVPGTAKKRYSLLDEKGNLLVRGLETVRKDWCNLAKKIQRDLLEIVLKEKNLEKAKKLVRETLNSVRKGKISLKDLIIYEQLTKPIEEYKLISPHVMAAKKMKMKGIEIEPGLIVMFVITKKPGKISDKAEPVEFVKEEDIDKEYYISNQILPAAMRVLAVFGIEKEELIK